MKSAASAHHKVQIDPDARTHLAKISDGDARKCLNALEIGVLTDRRPTEARRCIHFTLAVAEQSIQQKAIVYDRAGRRALRHDQRLHQKHARLGRKGRDLLARENAARRRRLPLHRAAHRHLRERRRRPGRLQKRCRSPSPRNKPSNSSACRKRAFPSPTPPPTCAARKRAAKPTKPSAPRRKRSNPSRPNACPRRLKNKHFPVNPEEVARNLDHACGTRGVRRVPVNARAALASALGALVSAKRIAELHACAVALRARRSWIANRFCSPRRPAAAKTLAGFLGVFDLLLRNWIGGTLASRSCNASTSRRCARSLTTSGRICARRSPAWDSRKSCVVHLRTGDTPSAERAKFRQRAAHILDHHAGKPRGHAGAGKLRAAFRRMRVRHRRRAAFLRRKQARRGSDAFARAAGTLACCRALNRRQRRPTLPRRTFRNGGAARFARAISRRRRPRLPHRGGEDRRRNRSSKSSRRSGGNRIRPRATPASGFTPSWRS